MYRTSSAAFTLFVGLNSMSAASVYRSALIMFVYSFAVEGRLASDEDAVEDIIPASFITGDFKGPASEYDDVAIAVCAGEWGCIRSASGVGWYAGDIELAVDRLTYICGDVG